MCFKSPKPPKVTTAADPELYAQRRAAEAENAIIKGENKQQRTEDQLAILSGRIGRKSLFSGGQGGIGFGARSIFGDVGKYQPGHRTPLPAQSPTGPAGGGPRPGMGPGGVVGNNGGSLVNFMSRRRSIFKAAFQ